MTKNKTVRNEKAGSIQKLTANFTGNVRYGQMEGKQWTVVPMVMLVEGVHNGNNGALYYPAEEIKKNPFIWNQKPVIVYHPSGNELTACSPEILTNRKVGVIMNTAFKDGKLTAEAWLDPERIQAVDERVGTAIENNEMMELSTGVYVETVKSPGVWNGESYDFIARNYQADHLALLPDLEGACSIEDGAGFLRLNQGADQIVVDLKEVKDSAKAFIKHSVQKLKDVVENELSHDGIRDGLYLKIREDGEDIWVVEVYDDSFIYQKGDRLYRQSYSVKEEEVTVEGLSTEVEKVTKYEIITNKLEGVKMTKEEKVEALIANQSTNWTEKDKKFLLNQDEENLDKMTPVEVKEEAAVDEPKKADNKVEEDVEEDVEVNAKVETKVENQVKKPVTLSQFITNAPPELQPVLREQLNTYNAAKGRLIKVITANERCSFTEKQLLSKEMDELKAIANLAMNTEDKKEKTPLYDYSGQGDPFVENESEQEPMPVPVLNFGPESK